MKKSNVPSNREPSPSQKKGILELPDVASFDAVAPRVDPDVFIDACAQWLPKLLARPEYWERRRAEMCPAEFDLNDPTRVPVSYPAQLIDDLLQR